MSTPRTGLYEGMFLFPQSATANLQEAIDHLKEILEKLLLSFHHQVGLIKTYPLLLDYFDLQHFL